MNPRPQQRRARAQDRLASARRAAPGPTRPASATEGEPVDLHSSVAGEEDPGASIDLDASPDGTTPLPDRAA